ncbi:MAG: hypothetical protein JO079_10525 [Frankiaceae bacterium]|nr:hypothetical protein [Frankiaceae bacterium]
MYAEYAPLRPGRRKRRPHRTRPFRTVRLNAVGWAALTGWILVWAAAFGAVASLAGIPPWAGCVFGAAAGLTSLLVVDRRRWGNVQSYYSWTDDPELVQQTVQRLTVAGMAVSYWLSPEGEPHLVYRQRDRRRVLRELGDTDGGRH